MLTVLSRLNGRALSAQISLRGTTKAAGIEKARDGLRTILLHARIYQTSLYLTSYKTEGRGTNHNRQAECRRFLLKKTASSLIHQHLQARTRLDPSPLN